MKTIESELFEAFDKERASDDLKMRTLEMLRGKAEVEAAQPPIPEATGNGKPSRKVTYFQRHLFSLVAACLCLVLMGTGGYKVYATETAFVSIDINPSIELGVNCFDRVISVRAFNEDGEAVLKQNDVLNMTYEAAVTMILGSDAIIPYKHENSMLSVVVVATKSAQEEKLLNASSACLERVEFSWECSAATSQVREEALQNGLSTGKYRAYMQLREFGSSMTIDECRDMTMRELNDLLLGYGVSSGSDSGPGTDSAEAEGDGLGISSGGEGAGPVSDNSTGNGAGTGIGDGASTDGSTSVSGSGSGSGTGAGSSAGSTGIKGQGSS